MLELGCFGCRPAGDGFGAAAVECHAEYATTFNCHVASSWPSQCLIVPTSFSEGGQACVASDAALPSN
jgi:hypothetical protein